MKPTFDSVTPLVPAGPDFDADLKFYVEHLGFTVLWRNGAMAGVARENVSFNLFGSRDQNWFENSSFSIGVSDLDALYEELRTIPAQVGPPEVKFWGRREFHVVAPSGVCFQFYETPKTNDGRETSNAE